MVICDLLIPIGLTLDILGVILIFFYGISPLLDSEGRTYRTTGEIDEKEKRKTKRYKCISRIGLIMIIIGFMLQLLAAL